MPQHRVRAYYSSACIGSEAWLAMFKAQGIVAGLRPFQFIKIPASFASRLPFMIANVLSWSFFDCETNGTDPTPLARCRRECIASNSATKRDIYDVTLKCRLNFRDAPPTRKKIKINLWCMLVDHI
jgi:hypothetical protein